MLNIYNQFRDFHVFKRFKYLLGDWWSIDILVVVKIGENFFYDDVKQLNNPIVKSLLSASLFKNYFLKPLNKMMKAPVRPGSNLTLVPWKQTGLDLFVTPLVLKDAPLEAFLVATGFAPKKEKELYQSLLYLGLSKKAVEQKVNNLKKLSETDEVYIQKMLRILAEEFFTLLQEKKKKDRLIEELSYKSSHKKYGTMLGKSPAIQYIFNTLERIKDYDSSILIEGENGTGKKLLARTIHKQSSRSEKPFYQQNFSDFKGQVLELEVFGSEAQSLPESLKGKKTLIEKINGGTLFLNEIGNTSLEFQAKLLRFLKEGVFSKKGNASAQKPNVKIISATSKNLKALVEKGQFNKELFLEINKMTIKLPPLRKRKEDIPLLIHHFLKIKKIGQMKISKQAMAMLYNYSWSGNIRELESEVKRLVSLRSKEQKVWTEQDLSPHIREVSSSLSAVFQPEPGKQNLKETLRAVEKQILLDCLKRNNWNKTKVAKVLGASRTSIILKAKEYGIVRKEGA